MIMILGITGGVGAGKSTVLHVLETEFHAHIIQSDQVAKDLMVPGGATYEPLVQLFGTNILDADGSINRGRMAAAMYASAKNKGRTIGYIIEEYIGKVGKKLFLAFCWLFCILVIAAFADVVAGTFNGFSVDEAGKVTGKIAANGSVAMTSILFILEAVALGCILKYCKFHTALNGKSSVFLPTENPDPG